MTNLRDCSEIKGRNIQILDEGNGCRTGKKQKAFRKMSEAIPTALGG